MNSITFLMVSHIFVHFIFINVCDMPSIEFSLFKNNLKNTENIMVGWNH